MSYIGKQPEFTQYPSKFFDGDGTAMTVTLDYAPPNDAALLVFIDGVRQDTSAYSCTGTSCVFTGAVPSGTANVQVVHMGLTVDVAVPADDTITTVKIQDDAVTVAKLANSINTDIDANTAKTGITSGQASAITANTAKVTNATHTGDVTGATALTIATDAVDIAMLSATGTASSSTFLRGDNTWTAAGGDNTPAFMAYMTVSASVSSNVWTKVACPTEVFDSDSAYDNSVNYRFTVPAGEGGKYYVYGSILMHSAWYSQFLDSQTTIYLNGSESATSLSSYFSPTTNYGYAASPNVHGVMDLSAADYIELWGSCSVSTGTPTFAASTSLARTYFGAHKLIGV